MYRYFWFDDVTEEYFGLSFANPSKDLTHTTILEKNHCMRWFGKKGKMAHLFLWFQDKIAGDERLSQFKKRVFYVYKSETVRVHKSDDHTQLDWLFPNYYSKTSGLSVRGFEFTLPNLSGPLKTFFGPLQNLINSENGTEETSSAPTQATFFSAQKVTEDFIKIYKNIPLKYYTHESYFLYDKSDLVKETFITALNKKYQFMVTSAILFSTKT